MSYLEEAVTRKLNATAYSLVSLTFFISVIGLVLIIPREISSIVSGNPLQAISSTDALLIALSNSYLIYIVASSAASYFLIKSVREHIHYSNMLSLREIVDRGDYSKALEYIHFENTARSIPSPISGFLLTLFTGGLAYPLMLYVCEKSVRRHDYSESSLRGSKPIGLITSLNLLLDLLLTVVTFGFWMIAWAHKVVKNFNTHVNSIHLKLSISESRDIKYSESSKVALCIAASFLLIAPAALKIPVYPINVVASSILITLIAYLLRGKSFVLQVLGVMLSEYYVLILVGVTSLLSSTNYASLLEHFLSQYEGLSKAKFIETTLFIFQNNLRIMLISLVPLLGSLVLGLAVGNTAFYLGLMMSRDLEVLSVLVMPHTPLELLAYAIAVSASLRSFEWGLRKTLNKVLEALIILVLAALVESALIVVMR
ncbi:MAG: hypothetical protein RMI83_01420 [Desulfurococcaceae archaeon]|nr:stage II sporulation protein M [Sulfolobales archaeon]MDW8169747.1 hypothetical protein [Desulfurococcaceae archaeon]